MGAAALITACSSSTDSGGAPLTVDEPVCYGGAPPDLVDLSSARTIPLLVVRVQYANATFTDNESVWADKIFGTGKGQLNDYFDEVTYGKLQFSPAAESSGIANNGVVTVTEDIDHPNTEDQDWSYYAFRAAQLADEDVNFQSFDLDNSSTLGVEELQVMFIVAGGESAAGISTPGGGVWGMASGMSCDQNGDGRISADPAANEWGVYLDQVRLLGSAQAHSEAPTLLPAQNGFSQFGERQGNSDTDTWNATIGIIAHELGHAFFGYPDLYCTDYQCSGIGAFGLMGAGSWGMRDDNDTAGATPVHLSAWSKEQAQICTPQLISSNSSLPIPAAYLANSASCGIQKIATASVTGSSDEYFLLENRSVGGYDQGLGILLKNASRYMVGSQYSGGLAIWHVIDNLSGCLDTNDCQNQSPALVSLEEANDADLDLGTDYGGSSGRTTHLFYQGNNDNFTDSSTPNSKRTDNTSTGIAVTSISAAGDNMTITVTP